MVPAPPSGVPVSFKYNQLEKHGSVYTLTGAVRIEYKDYILNADKVSFDQETSDAEADGHVRLQGLRNNELILADHGKMNFDLETGRFDNVTGSIGRQPSASQRKLLYTTSNPFLFTGRYLLKEGPERYRVIEGTMTSCLLPDPDWRIHSALIRVDYGQARASNSYFTLLRIPILYLPYVTHPVSSDTRETGLLIPNFGTSSTKGTVVGDSFYLVAQPQHGRHLRHTILLQTRLVPQRQFPLSGPRRRFCLGSLYRALRPGTGSQLHQPGRTGHPLQRTARLSTWRSTTVPLLRVSNLSSYVYREAFAESFALAIASQVTSSAFVTHNDDGVSASIRSDRYQNFEGITQVGNNVRHPADPHPPPAQPGF